MVWHVGDQIVEHAALPKQRVGAGFTRVGLQQPVHAEAFADRAEQSEQRGGEGADQQQPVAPHRLTNSRGRQPHTKAQGLGVAERRPNRPALGILVDQQGRRRVGVARSQTSRLLHALGCPCMDVNHTAPILRPAPSGPSHSSMKKRT